MKLGLNLLLHTSNVTERDVHVLENLRDRGYDGVEVPVMEKNPKRFAQLRQMISSCGLECTCSTALPGPEANPISSDVQARRAGLEYLLHCVDSVAVLGSKVLCGPTYQALGVFTGVGPTTDEFRRARDTHQIVADHAANAGISLAIEPLNRFECHFLNTLGDAASFVEEIGRPNVGILFDTFHANIEEKSLTESLARNVAAVNHVHLSENDRGIPGTGHIDFPQVIATLRRGAYKGWIVVEAFSRSLPGLAAATRIWRDLFESPQEVVHRSAAYFQPLLQESRERIALEENG